jgi:hypothetical protein
MVEMTMDRFYEIILKTFVENGLPNAQHQRFWLPRCERRLRHVFPVWEIPLTPFYRSCFLVLNKTDITELLREKFEQFCVDFQKFTVTSIFDLALEGLFSKFIAYVPHGHAI